MDRNLQIERAERLYRLHQGPGVLILPNVWDPLGARLLQSLDFPAVATSSAAVAYSLGYRDGQRIGLEAMCEMVGRIADSVVLPVTADIEAGYAEGAEDVARNVRQVLRAGAVGINLEDGMGEGKPLFPLARQCDRIRAVRAMSRSEGIPLFINARTDLFLDRDAIAPETRLEETIARARAYRDAGADCVFPILLSDAPSLARLHAAVGGPLNVLATAEAPPVPELEAIGVRRLSLGSGFLRAALTTMKRVALALRDHGTYESFTRDVLTGSEVAAIVRDESAAAP